MSEQLRSKGPDTLGHETTLARAPLFWPQRAVQLDLLPLPMLYGRPFRQMAGDPLTTPDQRLLAEFTTSWPLRRLTQLGLLVPTETRVGTVYRLTPRGSRTADLDHRRAPAAPR